MYAVRKINIKIVKENLDIYTKYNYAYKNQIVKYVNIIRFRKRGYNVFYIHFRYFFYEHSPLF